MKSTFDIRQGDSGPFYVNQGTSDSETSSRWPSADHTAPTVVIPVSFPRPSCAAVYFTRIRTRKATPYTITLDI